jgi:septal ring-binding cell division protein DamX
MSKVELDNVILFARGGFRGLAYNEGVMTAVAEAMNGMDIENSDGEVVGSVTSTEVVGSLVRGNISVDEDFLGTADGKTFMKRTAAKYEVAEKPTKKAASKPAPKTAAKPAAKTAAKPAPKTEAKKPVILRSVKSVKKPVK